MYFNQSTLLSLYLVGQEQSLKRRRRDSKKSHSRRMSALLRTYYGGQRELRSSLETAQQRDQGVDVRRFLDRGRQRRGDRSGQQDQSVNGRMDRSERDQERDIRRNSHQTDNLIDTKALYLL